MSNNNKKRRVANKSNNSSEVSKKLSKENLAHGLTVTYVYISPRIKFNSQHPQGKRYNRVSKLVTTLREPALFTDKGLRKSPHEIIKMLNDVANDLNANYFELN